MSEYLSIKQTANKLGVTTQTLRNWEKRGELVPYRNPINNYRMYKVEQIIQFIDRMSERRTSTGRFRLHVRKSVTD